MFEKQLSEIRREWEKKGADISTNKRASIIGKIWDIEEKVEALVKVQAGEPAVKLVWSEDKIEKLIHSGVAIDVTKKKGAKAKSCSIKGNPHVYFDI